MIARSGSPLRFAWLGALVLCVASFARAEPSATAPADPVDPQRLHRIETLVELSQFAKIYDATMLSFADPASGDVRARLIADTMRQVVWTRTRDGWLPLMARTIPDDVLDEADAFYASQAGLALVACVRAAEGQAAIHACGSIPEVAGVDVAAYLSGDFLRPHADEQTISAVFSGAFCGALAEDPSLLERIAAACTSEDPPQSRACSAFTRRAGKVELDRDNCARSF